MNATSIAADLADPAAPRKLFDAAEKWRPAEAIF
jgi:hypothetical protein